MSGSHRRAPRGSLRLLGVLAAISLGLATAPAQASPLTPPAPRDAAAAAAQVGPQIVDIDAKLGYQSAIGAGTGIVIDGGGVVLTNNHVVAGATDLTARSIGNGQTYPATVIGYDRTARHRGAAACRRRTACRQYRQLRHGEGGRAGGRAG